MVILKIDVLKIDKVRLFKGDKGTYLDAVLFENQDGTDKFGNDGRIIQSVTKEEREQGIKGAIIGNFKHVGQAPKPPRAAKKAQREPELEPEPEDDYPF